MAITFNQDISIIKLLKGTEKEILSNIDLLANDYLEKTGKKLNKGCSACILEMLLTLKNHYKMTQFKFKRPSASYKNKKGDTTTISNSTMTDEKAVEFLQTNPERIKLFSEFPSNWETLIIDGVESETDEEKAERIAIEAEIGAIETDKEVEMSLEQYKANLMKLPLSELRRIYPDIKATSIAKFVEKVSVIKVIVKEDHIEVSDNVENEAIQAAEAAAAEANK